MPHRISAFKLLNHVFLLSEFSSRVLVDVLTAGRFFKFTQSEVFTKALNKRIEVMCQQTIKRDDIIDAQPVIRSMTFDIIYGELSLLACGWWEIVVNLITTWQGSTKSGEQHFDLFWLHYHSHPPCSINRFLFSLVSTPINCYAEN